MTQSPSSHSGGLLIEKPGGQERLRGMWHGIETGKRAKPHDWWTRALKEEHRP